MSSVTTALVYFIAFSQIIVLYKLFRISAKLERKKQQNSYQVKRRNDNRNNQKKRNDNRTKNQNQNRTKNQNQKPAKQKPQRQVSSVDKSLRDINLRLKEAEEKQEKTRGKLSASSENGSKPKNENGSKSKNENRGGNKNGNSGNRKSGKIKRRSDNLPVNNDDSSKVSRPEKVVAKVEEQGVDNANDTRIKRRNLAEKPEVTSKPIVKDVQVNVEVASVIKPEMVEAKVAEVKVEKPAEVVATTSTLDEEVTFGRR